MKITPSKHIIKSGKQIQIREAVSSDSEKMIDCIKSYLKSNLIPLTDEEFNPTIEEHEKWITGFITGKNDLLLIAEIDGQIIGNIDLTANKRLMLKHTVYLGMGIHTNWQSQGIGTILVEKVIEWSNTNPDIELLWLQVFGNNIKGISLYKKFGFIENGRQSGFIKNPDGIYIDNVIMTRKNNKMSVISFWT